jgi:hypothetical protein
MSTADAFRIVPIILPDGRYLQQPVGVRVYQVRGGLHHGERGTYADLYDRFGRDNPNLVRDGEPHTVAEDGTDLLPVNVHLVLAGEESIVLRRLARPLGTSAPELLERFVADQTESARSAGSDERMLARQWRERVVWPGQMELLQIHAGGELTRE